MTNANGAFDAAYAGLNPEQRAAVDAIYGPVMVVAGPGTGKTQIIALRTANIIVRTGVRPENILLTTFTEAGVASMRKRLVSILGEDGYRVAVHTFHAFCTRVMEEYPEYFGSMRLDRSVDDLERYEMIESILDSAVAEHLRPIGDPYRYVRSIVSKIDTLKQENATPAGLRVAMTRQAERYAAELAEIKPTLKKYETTKEKQKKHLEKLEELATVYAEYQKRLRERGCYDYADMIRFVAEALDESDALVAALRERYQYMMVDEYQDTNSLQNHVMNRLASYGDEPNLLVVGDDDQSIYRFQGANIENMLEFAARYPDVKTVVLSKNYRSAQPILDLASRVIANNSERIVNR
jgi:DNA helicase II / ATP-dependent DNA helicase PcrA